MKTINILLKRALSPVKDFRLPVLVIYVGLSLMTLTAGVLTRINPNVKEECNSEFKRVEVIVPFFRVGCWLGGPLE